MVKVREKSEVDRRRRKRDRDRGQRMPGADAFLSVIEDAPEPDRTNVETASTIGPLRWNNKALSIFETRLGSRQQVAA